MKRYVLFFVFLICSVFVFATSKPSLDGRAEVAAYGELPSGLFGKSVGFLPGDTVIVTNPSANISIEVMIFGTIDAREGIAIVLSPEAAKELYISKGNNVIVQVTKKSTIYSESSILSKTLENYIPDFDPDKESEYYLDNAGLNDLLAAKAENEKASVIENDDFFESDDLIKSDDFFESDDAIAEDDDLLIPLEEILAEEIIPEEDIVEEEILAEEIIPEEDIVEEEILAEEITPEEIIAESEDTFQGAEIAEEADIAESEDTFQGAEIAEEVDIAESDEIDEEDFEVSLIATDDNPPVYTNIPVFFEDEIDQDEEIEDERLFDEPTVELVEFIAEEEPIIEEPIIEEVVASEQNTEIVEVAEIETPALEKVAEIKDINVISSLEKGKYYIQVATYSKIENVYELLNKYGNRYPVVCVKTANGSYQTMIGNLNEDEYAIVLERFKAYGFKDAFLRVGK